MKYVLGLLLFPVCAYTQVNMNVKAGASEKNIVMSLMFSYEVRRTFIEAGTIFHLDRRNPAYFGANIGMSFGSVAPFVGYYYRLKSNDKPKENYGVPNFGLRYQYAPEILKHFFLTAEVNYMDKMFFVLLGAKVPL